MEKKLIKMFEEIKKSGGIAYLCGGYVRDLFLDEKSKDIDIEVYGIERENLLKLINKYYKFISAGESFNVFIYKSYELSIPVNTLGEQDPYLSERDACKRRDFTINSILYDPLNNKILDYFNGKKDIEERKIKLTDENNFSIDPLRILRMVQFASRYNFDIEEKTMDLAKENASKINQVAKERIYHEFEKIFIRSKKIKKAFEILESLRLLENLNLSIDIKKIYFFYDCIEKRDVEVLFAIMFFYVETEKFKSYWDELRINRSKKKLKEELKKIIYSKKLIRKIEELIYYTRVFINKGNEVYDMDLRIIASRTDLRKVLDLVKIYYKSKSEKIDLEQYYKKLDRIEKEINPILKGRDLVDLGLEEGEKIGILLKNIYKKQLIGEIKDKIGAIEYLKDYCQ